MCEIPIENCTKFGTLKKRFHTIFLKKKKKKTTTKKKLGFIVQKFQIYASKKTVFVIYVF